MAILEGKMSLSGTKSSSNAPTGRNVLNPPAGVFMDEAQRIRFQWNSESLGQQKASSGKMQMKKQWTRIIARTFLHEP